MVDATAEMTPPVHRTLTDQVVRQLRSQIILGHLKPGERLVEKRLVEQLEVSRSTVREALRRLEAESLVDSASHRGSRVAALEPHDAFEICELHVLLETHALRHLRLPIDEPLRARLGARAQQMRALRLPEEVNRFIDLDNRFHRSIVSAAGQPRLLHVWDSLSALIGILVAVTFRYVRVDPAAVARRHAGIIEALAQPDPEVAAAVLGDHYRSLARTIREIASGTAWGRQP